MLPCIMIGDSIAVGVGQARPECETIAQVGISSASYIAQLLPPGRTQANLAVISLGVNDGAGADTLENLREVRSRLKAGAVVWLLPGLKEGVRDMIRLVAQENGDRTLDTRPQVGRDHLHPTGAGYEQIASTLVGPSNGEEVAYAPDELRRPLRASATPKERIRRLRAIRHAERTHVVPRDPCPYDQVAGPQEHGSVVHPVRRALRQPGAAHPRPPGLLFQARALHSPPAARLTPDTSWQSRTWMESSAALTIC